MTGNRHPMYESAYDPQSDLRLVRLSGPVQPQWLIDRGPSDPTLKHLPHCLTIVDLRRSRFLGAPSELAALAELMAKLVTPDFRDRYAWLVDRQATVGVALAFRRAMGGEGRIYWFDDVPAAVTQLGLAVADFERAESMLESIEPEF